ncbi:MAG: hypothetical protein IH630_02815 [Thermoplasmata archaeon]|nr:hypothetical protein [Thermoplasmata archaeon]MCJ7561857.1 DUF5788 family protein [Thermoplasmata archaeon]TFG67956.1 MAG: hypothetical protein E4H25_06715 [Methanomassiliicoccus sp.]
MVGDSDERPESLLSDGRQMLSEEERHKMISTIHSMVFWVGVLVPEYEVVGDQEIELRDIVYDLSTKNDLTLEDIARIDNLFGLIKTRERELEHKLAHDPMTLDAAKALMDEIRGLLRAMDDLRFAETDDHVEVGKAEVLSRVKDAQRWKNFVDQIKPTKHP